MSDPSASQQVPPQHAELVPCGLHGLPSFKQFPPGVPHWFGVPPPPHVAGGVQWELSQHCRQAPEQQCPTVPTGGLKQTVPSSAFG
jgi:hypothetical protein